MAGGRPAAATVLTSRRRARSRRAAALAAAARRRRPPYATSSASTTNRVRNRREMLDGALRARLHAAEARHRHDRDVQREAALRLLRRGTRQGAARAKRRRPFRPGDAATQYGPFFENASELVNCSIGEPFMMANVDAAARRLRRPRQAARADDQRPDPDRRQHSQAARTQRPPLHLARRRDARRRTRGCATTAFPRLLDNVRRLVEAKGGRGRLAARLPRVHAHAGERPRAGCVRRAVRGAAGGPAGAAAAERVGRHRTWCGTARATTSTTRQELLPFDELVRVSGRVAELCRRARRGALRPDGLRRAAWPPAVRGAVRGGPARGRARVAAAGSGTGGRRAGRGVMAPSPEPEHGAADGTRSPTARARASRGCPSAPSPGRASTCCAAARCPAATEGRRSRRWRRSRRPGTRRWCRTSAASCARAASTRTASTRRTARSCARRRKGGPPRRALGGAWLLQGAAAAVAAPARAPPLSGRAGDSAERRRSFRRAASGSSGAHRARADVHRAELRAAHRAERRRLEVLGGQRLVVHASARSRDRARGGTARSSRRRSARG